MVKPKTQILADQSEPRQRTSWRSKAHAARTEETVCPNCRNIVKASYSICPHCGRSLIPDRCSFCGSAMKENANFCSHCGQSRNGTICPECGTLNARNFCRKCNAPLTKLAHQAIMEANSDSAFKCLRAKADELAQLHIKIELLKNAPSQGSNIPQLSDSDKAMLDEYAELLGSIGACTPVATTSLDTDKSERVTYSDTTMTLEELMKAYREKAEEMNTALAALTPPPDFTPEQQRDYYSARKILSVENVYDLSGYQPTMWICNYCGAYHCTPSECAEPQLGGKWIYISQEEYVEKFKKELNMTSRLIIE